jgi:rhodanese-related sulfurtransferase
MVQHLRRLPHTPAWPSFGPLFASRARALVLVALALLSIAPLTGCGISDDDIVFVSIDEARLLHQDANKPGANPNLVAFIDPRSRGEFEAGHIAGARHIMISEMPKDARLRTDLRDVRSIIVYGNDPSSPAARGMTKRMLEIGYDNVSMLGDGLNAWIAQGLPTEQGSTGTAGGAANKPKPAPEPPNRLNLPPPPPGNGTIRTPR